MFDFTISATTLEDFRTKFTSIADLLGYELTEKNKHAAHPAQTSFAIEEKTEAPKKTRKKSEPKAEAKPIAAEVVEEVAAETNHTTNYEDVKQSLQELVDRNGGMNTGMAIAAGVLGKFGYKKLRDVKPEHFAEIVKAANELR